MPRLPSRDRPRPQSQGAARRRAAPSLSSVVAAKFVVKRMHRLVSAASKAASALDELMELMAADGGRGSGGGRTPGWAAAATLESFDPNSMAMAVPDVRPRSQ
jgi:hypothetical protein